MNNMNKGTDTTRQAIYERLTFKLAEEPALREALLADPKPVLAGEMGLQLPETVELRVVEDSALLHHLVIPWLPAAEQAQALTGAQVDDEAAVVRRALQDEGFKQRLLAEPKEALEELFGFCLPAEAEIKALEETPQTWYFVCPPQLDLAADELADWELEAVAGGHSSSICSIDSQSCSGAESASKARRRRRGARYPICH